VLYEFEPASPDRALEGCLTALDTCQVYLLIVGLQYGTTVGGLSITHAEYRRAKGRKLPVLAFIKGDRRVKREQGTAALLDELDADGPKYKRFGNVIELQKEVRAALVRLLRDRFAIAPTSDENETAQQTIEATSPFESRQIDRMRWRDLEMGVARRLIGVAEQRQPEGISDEDLLTGVSLRGLVWHEASSGEHYATAAGIVLLARDPSAVFPQCRILADAYRGAEPDGEPRDHEDIREPIPPHGTSPCCSNWAWPGRRDADVRRGTSSSRSPNRQIIVRRPALIVRCAVGLGNDSNRQRIVRRVTEIVRYPC
jgi:predicted HTH transcriptional regulator